MFEHEAEITKKYWNDHFVEASTERTLNRDEDCPGFKHFTIKPETELFRYAKGGIDTPYGRIESECETDEKGKTAYLFGIPENTTADVVLNGNRLTLGSGEYHLCG